MREAGEVGSSREKADYTHCWVCCEKVPQTGEFKPQKFIVSVLEAGSPKSGGAQWGAF